jgi:DNA repair protein RecN (Recombination protein N)
MLTRLQIRDFAIVDRIAVDFGPGMTVLTGETGAGKSILVDAVGLVLGERGGSQLVRSGAKRAEFSAEFEVSTLPQVRDWLEQQALDQDESCLLRRVINADGRSRAFINGNATTLQQLKELGEMLLDIHGQHFHQSLGHRRIQRELLDHFGELLELRGETETAFRDWEALQERLQQLRAADADRASRLDLLAFQLQELDALHAQAGEVEELRSERQRLKHSGALAEGISRALADLTEGDAGNAVGLVSAAARAVEALLDFDEQLAPVLELLDGAAIQIGEASDALQRYGDGLDSNPAHRDWVEERLDAYQTVARKHRVAPEQLPELCERLRLELDELGNAEERGKALEKQAAAAAAGYQRLADTLSAGRQQAARAFSAQVTEAMAGLGMPGGTFEVSVVRPADARPRAFGLDDIEFLISANPGQPLLPLSKVASGGELSRMSLAIQVVASDGSTIPTMIFDEVDSGVGGQVAEMVGRRLHQLGDQRQVFCVTHLPQVASLADQHIRISKVSDGKVTRTSVHELGHDERVQEIARMLGGVEITQKTVDHAAEMLAGAARKRA